MSFLLQHTFQRLADELDEHELLPFVSNSKMRSLGKVLCAKNNISSSLCHMIVLILLQDDQIDKVNITTAEKYCTTYI